MNDLERALADLADAAARAAGGGLLARPAVEPTLHRLVRTVRRRRAARAAAAGALALALVAGTAGAVDAGLGRRDGAPPAVGPTPSGGPSDGPTTSGGPTARATGAAAAVCGASDEALAALADPVTHPPVVGVTAPVIPVVAPDRPLPVLFTVDNLGAEKVDQLTADPRLVVTRDHVVVGAGALDGGSRGPALAGESTEYHMRGALWACRADGAAPDERGGDPLGPGEYAVWVLVDARPLGSTRDVVGVGGPFAFALVDPASPPDGAGAVDEVFPCGQAPTVTAATLPDVAGLTLLADVPPDGWPASGAGPDWGAVLAAGDRRVAGTVAAPLHLAFVGDDGLVAGRGVSDGGGTLPFDVVAGEHATLSGVDEPARCGADGTPAGALPAGAYWAWPYAEVTVDSVTRPDGVAEDPPAGVRVVVGAPTRVTLGG